MLIAAWAVGIDAIYIYCATSTHACRRDLDARARRCDDPPCSMPPIDCARRRALHLRRESPR
jgi:formate dehydrogenase